MARESLRRRHPGFFWGLVLVIVGLLAADAWLLHKRAQYRRESERLRADMDAFERERLATLLRADEERTRIMVELIRRQARVDPEVHLSVSVDSAQMFLERDGAVLREIPVQVGPARRVGAPPDTVHMVVPRGTRSVVRVLGGDDAWDVPQWVYLDRGLPVPPERVLRGALGPAAIVLDGGTVIYSLPSVGPLNDSSYVLPGGVRARAEDLRAILPNLQPGTTVYFY